MEETMEKYRILQIHNFYQIPGGEDVVVRNEKKLLEEHGHEVFTYYRSNKELNEGNKLKKLFIPFTAVYSLKTCREVKKIIRENKIDIVHVHNTLMMVSPFAWVRYCDGVVPYRFRKASENLLALSFPAFCAICVMGSALRTSSTAACSRRYTLI